MIRNRTVTLMHSRRILAIGDLHLERGLTKSILRDYAISLCQVLLNESTAAIQLQQKYLA